MIERIVYLIKLIQMINYTGLKIENIHLYDEYLLNFICRDMQAALSKPKDVKVKRELKNFIRHYFVQKGPSIPQQQENLSARNRKPSIT